MATTSRHLPLHYDQTPIRHGWNVGHASRVAHIAARYAPGGHTTFDDRHSAALVAIITELHAHDCDPGVDVLMRAANRAVQGAWHHEWSADGYDWRTGERLTTFVRYWRPAARTPLDEAVVERVAVRQIVAALTWRQRQVLGALVATDGHYPAAALLTGLKPNSIATHQRRIREVFLALWFGDETPRPGVWGGVTFRYTDQGARREVTRRMVREREERLGRPRLTEAECAAVRERFAGGESITSIASSVGRSRVLVTSVVRGTYEPAPGPVGVS